MTQDILKLFTFRLSLSFWVYHLSVLSLLDLGPNFKIVMMCYHIGIGLLRDLITVFTIHIRGHMQGHSGTIQHFLNADMFSMKNAHAVLPCTTHISITHRNNKWGKVVTHYGDESPVAQSVSRSGQKPIDRSQKHHAEALSNANKAREYGTKDLLSMTVMLRNDHHFRQLLLIEYNA